jgi:NAD(P)-dependent dehydrogenase (short-subunit alcohol dehydrogenase family)
LQNIPFGAFLCSQQVVPAMLGTGGGAILFTGATAGAKPSAASAAFGPAKFAMRGLAQVIARDLGPKGIHVACVNVDGLIDLPFIRPPVARRNAECAGLLLR